MQNLADIIFGTVQYNEEGVLMSIKEVCDVMTNKSQVHEEGMEAYSRLVKLAQVKKTHFHTRTAADGIPFPCKM